MRNSYSSYAPALSVIIPVYNVERYLHKCIDSVLSQTIANLELILVNDGSSDSSGAICDHYLARDRRVNVVHQNNKGSILARKAGLDIAHGKYVAFIDSDDWIDVELYEQLLQPMLQDSNIDISISPLVREHNGETIFPFTAHSPACWDAKEARRYMFEGKWFDWSLCGRIYKKELFNGIRISCPRHSHGDDAETNWEIFKNAKYIYYQPLFGYHYRDNPSSLTHQVKSLERFFYLDRLQYIANDNDVNDYELRRWIARIACVTGIDYMIDLLQSDDEYDATVISKYQKMLRSAYSMCKQFLSPAQLRRFKIALLDVRTFRDIVAKNKSKIVDAYYKLRTISRHIYIYGAGAIGTEISEFLKLHRLRYDGFVVSNLNNQHLHNKNISSFSDIYEKQGNMCGFILSMNKENEAAVERKLKNINVSYICVGQYTLLY